MVNAYQHAAVPLTIVGPGVLQKLPDLVSRFGETLVIVSGKSFWKQSGGRVSELLDKAGIASLNLSVSGEPDVIAVDELVGKTLGWGQAPACVVAIGGGSVLDAGKALSVMLKEDGSVQDYLEGVLLKKVSGKKLPFIAIPTTAGTGSEATRNAVIRINDLKAKKSLRHENYTPNAAMLDPDLLISCPYPVAAASGMDALCQLLESFLSTAATPLSDAHALLGLQAFGRSYLPFLSQRDDISAAQDMLIAAYCSGISLANAGLGIIHGIAGNLGGRCELPHGLICARLLPAFMKKTLERQDAYYADKMAQAGRFVTGQSKLNDLDACAALMDFLEDGNSRVRGAGSVTREAVALSVTGEFNKNHPVRFEQAEAIEIACKAFGSI